MSSLEDGRSYFSKNLFSYLYLLVSSGCGKAVQYIVDELWADGRNYAQVVCTTTALCKKVVRFTHSNSRLYNELSSIYDRFFNLLRKFFTRSAQPLLLKLLII